MLKITLLILFLFSHSYPQSSELLSEKISTFLNGDEYFENTSIAVEVFNLTLLENVYSLNNKLLLHPASNMKLLTTAAGLLFLKDYFFTTSIYYTGEIKNGTLFGNLYIKGGCDPLFSLADLDSLIIPLKNLNISSVSGKIFADVSFKDDQFWGSGWMWDDDPSDDAAYLSALNINLNRVRVNVNPPATITTEPATSYFNIENRTVVVPDAPKDTIYITRDWQKRGNTILVGGILTGKNQEKTATINVFDPAKYFLTLFAERLKEFNISAELDSVVWGTPKSAKLVYSLNRPFESVLNIVNKASNNLSAEMVIYALAEKYYGTPAAASNGLLMIDSLVKIIGLNPMDYYFADGSGVSHYNLVSAELLVSLLKYLYYQEPDIYIKLYNSLPIAGIDGTLKNRMQKTAAENRVHAKTGTLRGVSCLSGYVNSISGSRYAVSVLMQNYTGKPDYAKYIQDEIFRIIAEN